MTQAPSYLSSFSSKRLLHGPLGQDLRGHLPLSWHRDGVCSRPVLRLERRVWTGGALLCILGKWSPNAAMLLAHNQPTAARGRGDVQDGALVGNAAQGVPTH